MTLQPPAWPASALSFVEPQLGIKSVAVSMSRCDECWCRRLGRFRRSASSKTCWAAGRPATLGAPRDSAITGYAALAAFQHLQQGILRRSDGVASCRARALNRPIAWRPRTSEATTGRSYAYAPHRSPTQTTPGRPVLRRDSQGRHHRWRRYYRPQKKKVVQLSILHNSVATVLYHSGFRMISGFVIRGSTGQCRWLHTHHGATTRRNETTFGGLATTGIRAPNARRRLGPLAKLGGNIIGWMMSESGRNVRLHVRSGHGGNGPRRRRRPRCPRLQQVGIWRRRTPVAVGGGSGHRAEQQRCAAVRSFGGLPIRPNPLPTGGGTSADPKMPAPRKECAARAASASARARAGATTSTRSSAATFGPTVPTLLWRSDAVVRQAVRDTPAAVR